jgi:hypothetical protein
MRITLTPVTAGIAGLALAAGGFAAAQFATQTAQAQGSGDSITKAELDAALKPVNQRSQAAIRLSKDLQNRAGKFLQPDNLLIGAASPPGVISQDRGTGDGGFPSSVIKDGAIVGPKIGSGAVTVNKIGTGAVTGPKLGDGSVTEPKLGPDAVTTPKLAGGSITEAKLAAALQNKLPKWITKVDNGVNTTSRQSSDEFSVIRIGPGNYRADFGDTDISQCSWTAVPSVDSGLPAAFEIRTALDTTDPTRVVVRTEDGAATAVESGWQAQVFC